MRQVGHRESDAILGAMRQVALAVGQPLTQADTTSVRAAFNVSPPGHKLSS